MSQCRCYVEVYRRSKGRRSKNQNLHRLTYFVLCITISGTKYNIRRSKSADVRTFIFDVNEKYSIAIPGMTSSFVFTSSFNSSGIYTQKVQNILRRLLRLCRLDEVNLLEIYFVGQLKFTTSCQNDRVYTVEVY